MFWLNISITAIKPSKKGSEVVLFELMTLRTASTDVLNRHVQT